MYEYGIGVAQDYKEALRWYQKAADQGGPAAQSNLGRIYQSGIGVTQDFVQAHKWYNLSASAGDKDAAEARDQLAQQMTKEQISEAKKLAKEFTAGQ
jgi:TPR repeat protein